MPWTTWRFARAYLPPAFAQYPRLPAANHHALPFTLPHTLRAASAAACYRRLPPRYLPTAYTATATTPLRFRWRDGERYTAGLLQTRTFTVR